jgi:hypothetical protein
MRRVPHRERGDVAATLAVIVTSAMLAAAPGVAGAQSQTGTQSQSGSDQPSADARSSSQSAPETPKSQPKTAAEVGDRLHDNAKGFGEALLDSIKYAGNKVVNFFSDDKSKK